jgi:FtsP/CotA-like multicopper oxidase with cupredoxin domain
MNSLYRTIRVSGGLAVAVLAVFVLLCPGNAKAQARIMGIPIADGGTLNLTAKAGEISTPDGGSVHFWGYGPNGGLPQYPGPTLIVNQGDTVTVALSNELSHPVSMVFPGQQVEAAGGSTGLLTQESTGSADTVTYTFTATNAGTYTYHSGTNPDLQVEMGLLGAIIVRPGMGDSYAYNHADTYFDHEYLFLLTEMDPNIHQLAEQGRFSEIDPAARFPVYWFINGRCAPDTMAPSGALWIPHQPYNIMPRMTPGQKMLMRIIGAGQDLHPFHFHGNHARVIAENGRMLSSDPAGSVGPDLGFFHFTTMSVPGKTVDQIFEWTGEKLGWDIYGTGPDYEHDCNGISVNDPNPASAGFDPVTNEYCPDHGKEFPVILPEGQNLTFGGTWSGSPFMGDIKPLPPGEGGLNPFGGFFFMWHSHTEKEMVNFDIFPGGMMTMMVVEPPGTSIP